MTRSSFCLALLLLFAIAGRARAQFAIDTAFGLVGKQVRVVVHAPTLPRPGLVSVAATMQLSNPTVFFPIRFIAPAGDSIVNVEMKQVKDSIYQIGLTIDRGAAGTAGDTLVSLEGEALAGSDSVCVITLRNVTVGSDSFPAGTGVVITRSIGPPLPYVRFAILEQNYPNPVPYNGSTTWAYRIDKRSDISFHFFDLLGKEIYVAELGDQQIGPHTYIYTPPLTLPSGAYLVRLVTNSGSADKVMHILR
ncbi:MAG TPA: T9SS type A sorting domain-containing protein [Candidatus Kapabacteria bacterium]|nr:T9SS type A sorting domain-containing protein [Candidatus Kapabacteria bacterium]